MLKCRHTMVEVVSADNENDKITLWINPATKSATKMVQILPAMGNAKMTTTMKEMSDDRR